MRKLFICIMGAMTITAIAQRTRMARIPATPHPIQYVQPDGDTLTMRLHGDERKHYRTTLDGYEIIQDNKGYYKYAKARKNGAVKLTCRQAHNPEKRTKCENKFLERKGIKH